MIEMSSQIIPNCCYLCFSELLKNKRKSSYQIWLFVYITVYLPIIHTKTPENTARRKRGLL